MHFYSIHVIAEYNLSGSKIICNQICHRFNKEKEKEKEKEQLLG